MTKYLNSMQFIRAYRVELISIVNGVKLINNGITDRLFCQRTSTPLADFTSRLDCVVIK